MTLRFVPVVFVLAASLTAMASHGLPVAPCPAPSPLTFIQDDAGSGRDAGSSLENAAPIIVDGWSYGALTVPIETGMEDLHDWFSASVVEPREVTVDLQNVPNLLLDMGNQVPLIYYLEVWLEDGERPLHEFASWAQPFTFTADAGVYGLHVYPSPLMLVDACAPGASAPATLGVLPTPAQTYGIRFECEPACFG